MSDDDWRESLPDADDWKKIGEELWPTPKLEDIRKDPRYLRDKATLDFETGEIKPATDFLEWAQWLENSSRHIGYHSVSGFIVSTVFLGINHSFGHGPPLWFETMVFRADGNQELIAGQDYEQLRYSTIEDARAGHQLVVEAVQKGLIGE
jgi:hypothetical protein